MKLLFLYLVLQAVAFSIHCQYETTHWKVGMYMKEQDKQEQTAMRLDVYTPTYPGIYPVVLFSTGFGGVAPASFYSDLETDLAQQGVIVITCSKLHLMNADELMELLEEAYAWVVNNIFNEFKKHFNYSVIPDLPNNLFFLSHSWGGLVTTKFLMNGCGNPVPIRGQIMMDPIDGFLWNQPILVPGQELNFSIPTVMIIHGKIYGNNPSKPCFPYSVEPANYYPAYKGPTWVINFTDYGHRDNLQQWIITSTDWVDCPGCQGKNCNFDLFKQSEAQAAFNFINVLRMKDQAALDVLENPSKYFTLPLTSYYKLNGFDIEQGAICVHDNFTISKNTF